MIALALDDLARIVNGTLHTDGTAATGSTLVDGPVETDTREIVPGGIFVAKPGEVTDGHLFAEFRVGHCKGSSGLDRGVFQQRLIDLARRYFFAAAIDDFFAPSAEKQIAVIINVA